MIDRVITSIKLNYRRTLEKSLILTLGMIIIILLLFPTFQFSVQQKNEISLNFSVEHIPATKQEAHRPPPPKPAVPIPTDDESIPEDETIEITEFDFDDSFFRTDGTYPGSGAVPYMPARPIAEVIPEYPKGDYKKGITGMVKLHIHIDQNGNVIDVVVLENTTQSKTCAAAAVEAAYHCRYIPARQGNKAIPSWTTRIVHFEIPQ